MNGAVELLDGKGNKSESVKRRKYNIKKEKDQDLRPCFLLSLPRQGRSLWLPTLPFQKTNRYAVDGAKQMLFLLQTRINHVSRYSVDGSMLMFFLLQTRINHANRSSVVGEISGSCILYLLKKYAILSCTRIFVWPYTVV